MQTDLAVDTRALCRSYGTRRAVDDLNLTIRRGEMYALLGPNGAGKTTTIRMLTCLLRPTSGSARVLGLDLAGDSRAIKTRLNASPQETAVAPHLSVRENLELVVGLYGIGGDRGRRRVSEMLEVFGLEDRSRDRARRLSGGLQRRLSIAMALSTDPELLFLDEPSLGLDPQARRDLWSYIEGLKGEKTIVLTTHYMDEAEALADRVGVMRAGRLVAEGTIEELATRSAAGSTLMVRGPSPSDALVAALHARFAGSRAVDRGLEIAAKPAEYHEALAIIATHGYLLTAVETRGVGLEAAYLDLNEEAER